MDPVKLEFQIRGQDFINAGEASSGTKKALVRLGVPPASVKRAAIAMYEAEINAVIHANGGVAQVEIYQDHIVIRIQDHGPGIPNVALALQPGWSTAPDTAREMGFGAGMGLPNIKKNSDDMQIDTEVGKGTLITIKINF
ncbi:MAG: ATP-binding protein [Saccharofermentanales bacterium]